MTTSPTSPTVDFMQAFIYYLEVKSDITFRLNKFPERQKTIDRFNLIRQCMLLLV